MIEQDKTHNINIIKAGEKLLKEYPYKFIWGDNKVILYLLSNGPKMAEVEKEGGLKLIYIDPPFDADADFIFNIEIGGKTAEKKQNITEEIAYCDTRRKGISSYLKYDVEKIKINARFIDKYKDIVNLVDFMHRHKQNYRRSYQIR